MKLRVRACFYVGLVGCAPCVGQWSHVHALASGSAGTGAGVGDPSPNPSGPHFRRKGASREVEDVTRELDKVRSLEHLVERDLAAILAAVSEHGQKLARLELVLAEAVAAAADHLNPPAGGQAGGQAGGGLAEQHDLLGRQGRQRPHPSEPARTDALGLAGALSALRGLGGAIAGGHDASNLTGLNGLNWGLAAMRRDLGLLVKSLNASAAELNEVREVTGQKEIVDGLLRGKVESTRMPWTDLFSPPRLHSPVPYPTPAHPVPYPAPVFNNTWRACGLALLLAILFPRCRACFRACV